LSRSSIGCSRSKSHKLEIGDEGGGESCEDSRIIGSDWPEMSVRSVVAFVVRRKLGTEVVNGASCCDEKGSVGACVRKTALFLGGSGLDCIVGVSLKEVAVHGQTRRNIQKP
jgi:hypothetical protein